jgi:hypothetical protein
MLNNKLLNNKLLSVGDEIKKTHGKKLQDFTYICPDDRQYIESGNLIKYINIRDLKQKIKTGIVINFTNNKILLKSLNSAIQWTIKMTDCHIFYKFKKDDLIDAINDLLEKNEINNK